MAGYLTELKLCNPRKNEEELNEKMLQSMHSIGVFT
jgi:hypothetical protein